MCGRYLFSLQAADPASRRLMDLFVRQYPGETLPEGEVFPGSTVPILLDGGERLRLCRAKWGFDTAGGKALINARWETAREKPLFREAMVRGRCVIPVSGFYEWNSQGEKHLFQGQSHLMYLAGLLRDTAAGPEFVILTRTANRYVQGIHHRMPVILPQSLLRSWVSGLPQGELDTLSPAPLSCRRLS